MCNTYDDLRAHFIAPTYHTYATYTYFNVLILSTKEYENNYRCTYIKQCVFVEANCHPESPSLC